MAKLTLPPVGDTSTPTTINSNFDAIETAVENTLSRDVTTGALTGTTGVNGNVTVSAHTDGNIYVENRSGVTLVIAYTVLNDS